MNRIREMKKWRNELRKMLSPLLDNVDIDVLKKKKNKMEEIKKLTVQYMNDTFARFDRNEKKKGRLPVFKRCTGDNIRNTIHLYLDKLAHRLNSFLLTTTIPLDDAFLKDLRQQTVKWIDEEYTINVFVKTECKPIEKTDVNESTDKSDKLKCNNAHKLSKKSHQIKHRCKDNKKPAFTAILKESQTSGEKHVPKLVIRKKPIICHDNEQTTRTDKSSGNVENNQACACAQRCSAEITNVKMLQNLLPLACSELVRYLSGPTVINTLTATPSQQQGTSQAVERPPESSSREVETRSNSVEKSTETINSNQESRLNNLTSTPVEGTRQSTAEKSNDTTQNTSIHDKSTEMTTREESWRQDNNEKSNEPPSREKNQSNGERSTEMTSQNEGRGQNTIETATEVTNTNKKSLEETTRTEGTRQNINDACRMNNETNKKSTESTNDDQEMRSDQNNNANTINNAAASNYTENSGIIGSSHSSQIMTTKEAESAGIIFYCYYCKNAKKGCRFYDESKLRAHLKSAHESQPFRFYAIEKAKCFNCTFTGSWRDLNHHYRDKHSNSVFSVVRLSNHKKCALCDYPGKLINIHSTKSHTEISSSVFNPLLISSEKLSKLLANTPTSIPKFTFFSGKIFDFGDFFVHLSQRFLCHECNDLSKRCFIELLEHKREVHGKFDYDNFVRRAQKDFEKTVLDAKIVFENGLTVFGRNLIDTEHDVREYFENAFTTWTMNKKHEFNKIVAKKYKFRIEMPRALDENAYTLIEHVCAILGIRIEDDDLLVVRKKQSTIHVECRFERVKQRFIEFSGTRDIYVGDLIGSSSHFCRESIDRVRIKFD